MWVLVYCIYKECTPLKKCKIEFKSHHLQDFPYCPPTVPFPSPPLFFQNHPFPCPWIQCTNYSEITMYLMLKWSNVAFISSGSTASMMWPECVTVSDSLSLDAIYLGGNARTSIFSLEFFLGIIWNQNAIEKWQGDPMKTSWYSGWPWHKHQIVLHLTSRQHIEIWSVWL